MMTNEMRFIQEEKHYMDVVAVTELLEYGTKIDNYIKFIKLNETVDFRKIFIVLFLL